MMYNYSEAIKDDIRTYLDNDFDWSRVTEDELDADDLKELLDEELWTEDSITGNGSGSYTFNRYTAKEYVMDNEEVLGEMICDFGITTEDVGYHFINNDWEWFDVSIRCYLLRGCIDEVVDEYTDKIEELTA